MFLFSVSLSHCCFLFFSSRRLYDDILELVEHSFDVNLIGNQVRYRFQDSPVLEGLTIHETQQGIVVLVCTVSSVHRLKFPYHDRGFRQVCSIFWHYIFFFPFSSFLLNCYHLLSFFFRIMFGISTLSQIFSQFWPMLLMPVIRLHFMSLATVPLVSWF